MSIDMRVILLVEDDKTLYILCRVGNSWGSHVQDGYKCINEKMDSHITKIRWAFRHSVSFWKIFGNRCRSMWGSYSWLRTTRLYTTSCRVGNSLGLPCVCTWWLQAYQQKDGLSHYQKFDKLFSIWFHFKRFLGTDVDRCEGHTLGWGRHDSIHPRVELESLWGYHVYVYDNHVHQQRDGLSHYQNLSSLSALGSIFWKIFGNRSQSMWGSYSWLRTTRLYTSL